VNVNVTMQKQVWKNTSTNFGATKIETLNHVILHVPYSFFFPKIELMAKVKFDGPQLKIDEHTRDVPGEDIRKKFQHFPVLDSVCTKVGELSNDRSTHFELAILIPTHESQQNNNDCLHNGCVDRICTQLVQWRYTVAL
jgi:hypothetical protein